MVYRKDFICRGSAPEGLLNRLAARGLSGVEWFDHECILPPIRLRHHTAGWGTTSITAGVSASARPGGYWAKTSTSTYCAGAWRRLRPTTRRSRNGRASGHRYPGGATSVGAVTATLLKAFFDESQVVTDPVQPDPADPTRLVPFSGPRLTVGGELNKLAVNFGFGRVLGGHPLAVRRR
jgi:hypothetical protein